MPRIRTVLLVSMAVALLALAGCASADAPDPAALEGDWVVESFGGATELTPADPAVTSEMTFEAGEVSGNGGVNSFGGSYETPGDNALTFGALAATEMAGPPEAMEQESTFFKALEDTEHFEFNDEKLVLSDAGNNALVVLVAK